MKDFQKRGKWEYVMQSKPFLIFFGVLILFFIFSMFGFMNKMEDTSKNRKIAEDRLLQLQTQKDKLTADISKLNTTDGVEEVIRDKFGLVKEGEGMIVIVEDQNKEVAPAPSRFSRFMSFFANLFE
jgi:cell division protein FtsB